MAWLLKFRYDPAEDQDMRASDKTLRIQKLMRENPQMTDAQIARKIGMDSPEGRARVAKERPKEQGDDGSESTEGDQ